MRCEKSRLSKTELAFCAMCFLFYLAWAIAKPFNYAPDEAMRYDVTRFLFDNNRLPAGDELLSHWGFSYAHLPTVLCNELGYVFMKLASVFTNDDYLLLIAARLVSVCCGTGSVLLLFKTGKRILSPMSKWFFVVFVSLMPQFAFLSSYVNNDIVAFLGITIILYAWVWGMQEMWNFKNATLLAVGISVCALSYYNSYPWILLSVFFFFAVLYQNDIDAKKIRLLTAYVIVLVLLLIGYSFIRHLVLYGDLLGFDTSHYYGEKYAIDSLKPSNRVTLAEQGVSILSMLFSSQYAWLRKTGLSFIAVFGYMSVWCNMLIYIAFISFLLLGCVGAVAGFMKYVQNRKTDKMLFVLYSFMIICAVLSVFLSIYNSYVTDFQPQGRYIYPAFPTLALIVSKGWEQWISLIKSRKYKCMAGGVICTSFAVLSMYVFVAVYLPS